MEKWTKWYKNKSGKDWVEGEYSSFIKTLSDKDRETAKLLYNGYVKDKGDIKTALKKMEEEEIKAEKERGDALLKAKKVERGLGETLLAEGKYGKEEREKEALDKELRRSEKDIASSAYLKNSETAATLNDKLAVKGEEREAKVSEKIAAANAKEEKEYFTRLEKVNEILSNSSIKRDDGVKYYESGKKKAKDYLKGYEKALGDKYEEALRYIDDLPAYNEEKDGYETIGTRYGNVKVSNKDIAFLDAVRYKEKAGWLIVKGETYYVTFDNVSYKVKCGVAQDPQTKALLDSLAIRAGLNLSAGATLYYKDKLYVYTGVNDWREVIARSGEKGDNEFRELMNAVGKKYNEK